MSAENPHQPIEFNPPSVEHLGELLRGYEFEGLVAKGGMGAVYKANQTSLDRPVAIKVLPPELGESVSFRASFEKEAKLMARLNHPNLISVYDFGEIEGMLYIVMEFVDGATLYEKTYNAHLEQMEALRTIISICNGLSNAHEAGILHRDIKPANIFITDNGTPKIGDFGLARPSGGQETGVIYGTPGYTAPEVLGAPDQVGPATDIYAVGIMLYELLAGKQPSAPYEPVHKYAKCDIAIDRIIRKSIAPNLHERYHSAEDLSDDLDEIYRKLKKAAKSQRNNPALQTRAPKTQPVLAAGANKPARTLATAATSNSVSGKLTKKVPVATKKPSALGGSNIRNFFIITILVGAIYGVLQWKKAKEADHAARLAAHEAASDTSERTKPQKTNKKPSKPKKVTKDIPVVELSTIETLAKISDRLRAGDRPMDEMPKDAITLDDDSRIVAFIDKELSWQEADRWCRMHGGYLVTIASASDIRPLKKLIPEGENIWVGAATGGNKQWVWSDGTPWNDAIEIRTTSKLSYARLDSDMFATTANAKDTAKFIIEWKTDGSDPATLEQRMQRAAENLTANTPTYPPGSVTLGAKTYFITAKELSLSEAHNLAKTGGATLAVPSDSVEAAYLSSLISDNLPSNSACRIGGILNGNQWMWITGEDWAGVEWYTGHPQNGDSLQIEGSTGKIQDVPQSNAVEYTLFEWSNDAKGSTPIKLSTAGPDPSVAEFDKLQTKASELIQTAITKQEQQRSENIKSFVWDLETYFKRLASLEQDRESDDIERIKELVEGETHIHEKISEMDLSKKVQKITDDAYEKQVRIDKDFEESVEKVRTAYRLKLEKIIEDLEKQNQTTAANEAKAAYEASDTSALEFIELF